MCGAAMDVARSFCGATGCLNRYCGFLNDAAGAARLTLQISYGTFWGYQVECSLVEGPELFGTGDLGDK